MFTLNAGGLVAAYIVLALLLLSVNLYSNWRWPVKIGLIVLVSAFYIVSYLSIPPLLGWPTDERLPRQFNLVAIYVQEPDKLNGTEGDIYIWVTDMRTPPSQARPRAYRLPFTPELHARVVQAGNKLRKNLPQLGEIEEEGPGATPLDTSQLGQESVNIQFYDLPDPLFPEK